MNPRAYIIAGIESATRLLMKKPYSLPASELSQLHAEVWDGRHIVESGYPENYKDLPEKAQLSCRVIAVSMAYLDVFGSNTQEEVVLAVECARLDWGLHSAQSKFQANRQKAQSKRIDALTEEIIDIVSRYPRMTWRDVLNILRDKIGLGLIEDVADTHIEWWNKDQLKTTPITGLPDRLTTARKHIK